MHHPVTKYTRKQTCATLQPKTIQNNTFGLNRQGNKNIQPRQEEQYSYKKECILTE